MILAAQAGEVVTDGLVLCLFDLEEVDFGTVNVLASDKVAFKHYLEGAEAVDGATR